MPFNNFLFPRKILLALFGGVFLPGCLASNLFPDEQSQTETQAVLRNEVIVSAPTGYCLSSAAPRTDGTVLFGSCAALRQTSFVGSLPHGAVVVVSVGVKIEHDLNDVFSEHLQGFFATETGHTALSQSDDANAMTIHANTIEDDVLFLRIEDQSDNFETALDRTYWRGVLPINGHLVSISVFSSTVTPISRAEGREILEAFVHEMETENVEMS
ncbi:hypothetical protein [Cochlodiniinecator piscidefendens]|uniref:hypothetical protein n=1 Tax=Cochlodiniinecator piscidefendens TaxID=2715756 RepID=UPI00140D8C2C|nr:hypothetical protein [Cochlodiniinecator piscidefendens]